MRAKRDSFRSMIPLSSIHLAATLLITPTLLAAAEVKLTQEANRIVVQIDGKPFTNYYFGPAEHPYVRPYLYPLLASDGAGLTSDQLDVKDGDNHPHHRSMWVSHGEVNGVNHWALENQLSGKGYQPQQKHIKFERISEDTIVEDLEWEDNDAKPMLKERRSLRFFAFPDQNRGIDLTVEFTPAAGAVKFADTKEAGICSVRMATEISKHATITLATGATATGDIKHKDEETAVWGKPADWCDETGQIAGKTYGITIFDHPSNPRHPSRWMVRLYGLMTSNIFGGHAFDPTKPKGAGDFTIEPGKTATFRYRVVFHTGDVKDAKVGEKYKEYAEVKG